MKEIESWQNGNWIPNSQLGVKAWDSHFFFGHAVFDAFRTYKHIPHMLNCHVDRFYKSAKMAFIDIDMKKEDMIKKIHEIMEHNKEFFPKDEEFRFMMFASNGTFKIYEDIVEPKPTLTIDVTTVSRYAKFVYSLYKDGCISSIVSQRQIPSRFLDPKIKNCSRLHYCIADAEAGKYGNKAWPILLDEHGYIAESSGANFGFIKDDIICLPKENNILRGCTLKFVEENVIDDMYVVKENWEPYDVIDADAAFFTSTFLGLVPNYELWYRNKKFVLDKGKDIINKMMDKYSKALNFDVNKQWQDWYEKSL